MMIYLALAAFFSGCALSTDDRNPSGDGARAGSARTPHSPVVSAYIRGTAGPLTIEDWRAAVAATEGVRITDAPLIAVNPQTGERIELPSHGATGEVLHPGGKWQKTFFWSSTGAIEFATPATALAEGEGPTMEIAMNLATRLSAAIVDEYGEVHPLR